MKSGSCSRGAPRQPVPHPNAIKDAAIAEQEVRTELRRCDLSASDGMGPNALTLLTEAGLDLIPL